MRILDPSFTQYESVLIVYNCTCTIMYYNYYLISLPFYIIMYD